MSATTVASDAPLEPSIVVDLEAQQSAGETEMPSESSVDSSGVVSEEREAVAPSEVASPVEPVAAEVVPIASLSAEQIQQARVSAAAKIRSQGALPRGLREQLATLALSQGEVSATSGAEVLLPIDAAIAAVRAAIPRALSITSDELEMPDHHGGESFFVATSVSGELTDEQAEEAARKQLQRTGFARVK